MFNVINWPLTAHEELGLDSLGSLELIWGVQNNPSKDIVLFEESPKIQKRNNIQHQLNLSLRGS